MTYSSVLYPDDTLKLHYLKHVLKEFPSFLYSLSHLQCDSPLHGNTAKHYCSTCGILSVPQLVNDYIVLVLCSGLFECSSVL